MRQSLAAVDNVSGHVLLLERVNDIAVQHGRRRGRA
jgi:hypothetical protein